MAENVVSAVGRRKTATAIVRLMPGGGKITVNGRELDEYFGHPTQIQDVKRPLMVSENLDKFDIICRARGGGYTGQAGAIRLGIARALLKLDEEHRKVLKKDGLLTRDPRMVERKKYGLVKARKRFQFSKR
ncbi:MAG: 30S ribosomal protein S9 [candidate division Zixibacteria bacterium]|nr:30S ribosomal protein S9 [candidate division Zixibacteria bacterium]